MTAAIHGERVVSDYDLFDELEADAKVDETNLDGEVLKTAYLQSKWMKRYIKLNSDYRQAKRKTAKIYLERQQYYLGTAGDEVYAAEPLNRKVLKSEVGDWLDADEKVQAAKEEEEILKDVTLAIEKFITTLNNRGMNINSAINYLKWKNGG